MKNRIKSFTLIELVIVMAIMGLLVSLLLPSLTNAKRKGYMAVCLSNQRQIMLSMAMYVSNNKNYVPYAADWGVTDRISFDDLLSEYDGRDLTRSEMLNTTAPLRGPVEQWKCPADNSIEGDPAIRRTYSIARGGIGLYGGSSPNGMAGLSGSSRMVTSVDEPDSTFLLSEMAITFWSDSSEAPRLLGYPWHMAVIDSPLNQDGSWTVYLGQTGISKELHLKNKFNYLFVDGHAQNLSQSSAVGTGSNMYPRGMWTFGAGD